MDQMLDFITLLQRDENTPIVLDNPLKNSVSEKTCSYIEFIEMIQKVVTNVIPDCLFIPDDEINSYLFPDKPLDKSIVSFKVFSRKPYQELKPLPRHEIIETTTVKNEARIGSIYGQRMQLILQFNIFSSGYAKSESVMTSFEDSILDYTSFFKKKGVIEILFREQIQDTSYEHFRKTCSMRHLHYEIILEKQWIDFESVLETVQINP